jgi:nucleoside phosphorylase/CheY-like chemotaxis protein
MNILIVDDSPQRYRRFVEAIQSLGIDQSDVDTAVGAKQADECLQKKQYDLLILDIVLPVWPQGEADPKHALDLLFTIHADDEPLHRPRHIVGITSDRAAADRAASEFAAYTWTIIEYSPTDDAWLARLVACVRYLVQSREVAGIAARAKDHTDVAIVCALATPELSRVLELPWNWLPEPSMLPDATFVHRGSFKDATGRTVSVAAAHAPRMGMVSSALLTASLIESLRPRMIVMAGICAGLRGKVGLGDVLLADPSWDFQSGKRVMEDNVSDFVARAHQLPVSMKVRKLLQEMGRQKADAAAIAAEYGGDPLSIEPKIMAGPVACGSSVLADGEVIEEIKRWQHGEVVGVEMEIYGVYAAAAAAAEPQPIAFAVKGVCDFADPDKADGAQDFAAYMSANVVRLMLERHASFLMP